MYAEVKWCNVDAVKERLETYIATERDIENQIERLERLETRMIGMGAQTLTDMPKAPSPANDRMAMIIGQKEELEQEIRDTIEFQKRERKWIEGIVKHLKNPDERAVIRLHYLDKTDWNDISDVLFGGRVDFLDKQDTYLRRCFRIHGSALVNMARYIEEHEDPNTAIPANP